MHRNSSHFIEFGATKNYLIEICSWFIIEFSDHCAGTVTVFNPEYVVSRMGRFMLSHNGYTFTAVNRSKSSDNRTTWRCSHKGTKNQKGCKATAISSENMGSVKAIIKGVHCHEPKISTNNWKKTIKLLLLHLHIGKMLQLLNWIIVCLLQRRRMRWHFNLNKKKRAKIKFLGCLFLMWCQKYVEKKVHFY